MTRRSKALVTFHPNDQKQLIDLINKARIQKGCTLVERGKREEISTEMSNMKKNRQSVKFREEDNMWKAEKKSRKLPNKRISWRKNLTSLCH